MEQKAIAESSCTRRSCRETEEPVNNWLKPKFGNLHSLQLSHNLQQFLFFVNHGYAHISLLCFPLVMLSASHWLLSQALFCGRTHQPLSPNSTTPTVQVIFRYLRLDAPVFNITTVSMVTFRQSPWCSHYRRRKWTRRLEFKSWTRLIAFHIALIPLGKVWIQLFSLQLWVNSRTD